MLEIAGRSLLQKSRGTPRLGLLTVPDPVNGFAIDRHVLHCNCHGAACSAAAVVGFWADFAGTAPRPMSL